MSMLLKPHLALCTNKNTLPKSHPSGMCPNVWFNPDVLKSKNLYGLSFDFFVNWSEHEGKLTPVIWLKTILKDELSYDNLIPVLKKQLISLFGKEHLVRLSRFSELIRVKPEILIFNDSLNWENDSTYILKVIPELKSNDIDFTYTLKTLSQIKQEIKNHSGGPITIGKKGLTYGTSRLECKLSKTDSLYPGDADLLMLNNQNEPVAILEFKKHNLESSITEQKLSNYYPALDKRKYDRLAILRDHIQFQVFEIPILNIYYPTKENLQRGKVELITGKKGELKSAGHTTFNIMQINERKDSPIESVLRGIQHFKKHHAKSF